MLKKINAFTEDNHACTNIKDVSFPAPFSSGLEYSCSARGTWNIVHTGMLVPEAHEIFVCAGGCLRGVVLTAAEMHAEERFSTVEIRENNVLDGDMEDLIINGVTDILNKLPYKPRAVLVYTSCIHHFIGCDLKLSYTKLREAFPDIAFTDCYMNPIMRKSGLTPDQLMRRQLYSLLDDVPKDYKSINIIGNNFSTNNDSELIHILNENGYRIHEITRCKSYDEYLMMSESFLNITYNPVAKAAGDALIIRLNQEHLYLPVSYSYSEISTNITILTNKLNISTYDYSDYIEQCEVTLAKAKQVIGNSPICIDYTAILRPLSLARLLLDHDFNVTRIYADSFSSEEADDFKYLQQTYPHLKLYATVHHNMRIMPRTSSEKTLAIGQKAAYFCGTDNFVNIVENGGFYGFSGICKLCELMIDAFNNTKDARSLIQIKGLSL